VVGYHGAVTFDPTAPQAAHWRQWLTGALGDRGIPPNAALELQVRPCGGAAITRLQLDLRWAEPDAERRAHVEVLVPIRRAIGTGWSGWPAYAAGLKLLRALG
jgi:hypothetical protein